MGGGGEGEGGGGGGGKGGGGIHSRISFVILCNASMKRNGHSATTYLFYRYFQVEKHMTLKLAVSAV